MTQLIYSIYKSNKCTNLFKTYNKTYKLNSPLLFYLYFMGDCTDCVRGICGGLSWRKWWRSEITMPVASCWYSNYNPCLVGRSCAPSLTEPDCLYYRGIGTGSGSKAPVSSWPLKPLFSLAEFGAEIAPTFVKNLSTVFHISIQRKICEDEKYLRDSFCQKFNCG